MRIPATSLQESRPAKLCLGAVPPPTIVRLLVRSFLPVWVCVLYVCVTRYLGRVSRSVINCHIFSIDGTDERGASRIYN